MEFCQGNAEARKIKGGAEVRKDVGIEELEKQFDNLTSMGFHMEQSVEMVKKLYKDGEKSKEKSKAHKTRVKE